MITLNFKVIILDRAACGTGIFKLLEYGFEIIGLGVQAGDDRVPLAFTLLAMDSNLLVLGQADIAIRVAWTGAFRQSLVADFTGYGAFQ